MIHEFYAEQYIQEHERELVKNAENRRLVADRVAAHFGGDRLAVVAWLARHARANSAATAAHPAGC